MRHTNKIRSFGALLLATGLALGGAACKDEDERDDDDLTETTTTTTRTVEGPGDTRVTVETRRQYETEARGRLARIDARLTELRARADAKATAAADELRVKRDELARRLDRAGDEADASWDRFKADVSDGLDKLEDDLDARF